MGRPPIGKQPMTGAERQRRYFARLLAAHPRKPELAQVKAENASLKARIAELVKAGARKPVTKPPVNPDSELARAKATIVDLRRALRHFQKRPMGKIDERSFTIIRSRMHPDRVSDPEKKARYKIAFEVFGELEKAVVDKEQLRLVREQFFTKPEAKKRTANRAAKANPPKSLGRR